MNDVAIKVENLGKRYQLGQRNATTLREAVGHLGRRLLGRGRNEAAAGPVAGEEESRKHIWAIRDMNFEIRRGDVVGIIGRNGAGKSTLLKILSQVTVPTLGRAVIHGRVGSLLEVGTGFHPELSGRENVFLNGAILGMSRADIRRRFDDIVAFAELARFIDTPVKRYSSGMYTRLAFAVAAHLDPEILIIDEVLAVGDLSFQKKCLGKMDQVARGGRTILFVSHSMQSVQSLCQSAILLEGGRVSLTGTATEVVGEYRRRTAERAAQGASLAERTDRGGTGAARVVDVVVRDADLRATQWVTTDEPCHIDLHYQANEPVENIQPGLGLDTPGGLRALTLFGDFTGHAFSAPAGQGVLRCRIERLNLRPDRYSISAFLGNRHGAFDVIEYAGELEVTDSSYYSTGHYPDDSQGPMIQRHDWSHPSADSTLEGRGGQSADTSINHLPMERQQQ